MPRPFPFLRSVFAFLAMWADSAPRVHGQATPPACAAPVREWRNASGPLITSSDTASFWSVESVDDKTPQVRLMRHNRNGMEAVVSRTFDLPQPPGGGQHFSEALAVDNHLLLFTTGKSADGERFEAYASIVDASGQVTAGPSLVHYTRQGAFSPALVVRLSPDRSKLLLLFDFPFERKAKEAISLHMFDPSLDLLWERELELPYEQDVIQVHHFQVDNDGGVFLMSGQPPVKNATAWQRPQGSRYVVFYYHHRTNRLKEYDVSLKDKQVLSAQFAIDPTGQLVIAGYYSNDFRFSVAGTFLFVVSAGGEGIGAAAFMAFQKDFLLQFMNQKQADRNGTLSDFYLDHLLLHEDGSYSLVGEQYYVTEEVIMDPTTGRQILERRYNYDDLIVTRLRADGRIEWSAKVPKRQYGLNARGGHGYNCLLRPDGAIDLVFNDHSDNASRLASLPHGDALPWNGTRGGVVTRATLARDGKLTRNTLSRYDDMDMLVIPETGQRDPRGIPVIGYAGGREWRLCLLP